MSDLRQVTINGVSIKEGDYIQVSSYIYKVIYVGRKFIDVKKLYRLGTTTFWYHDVIDTMHINTLRGVSKVSKLKQIIMDLDNIKDFHEVIRKNDL